MKRLYVLYGLPGCGKTALGEALSEHSSHRYLSIGSYLYRIAFSGADPNREIVESSIKSGVPTPLNITLQILSEYLEQNKASSIIIDGLPRMAEDIVSFIKCIVRFGYGPDSISVIYLVVDGETAIKRALARRREDDILENLVRRHKGFYSYQVPAMEHLSRMSKVFIVDAASDAESVFRNVKEILLSYNKYIK